MILDHRLMIELIYFFCPFLRNLPVALFYLLGGESFMTSSNNELNSFNFFSPN